jgi:hypothetical protein
VGASLAGTVLLAACSSGRPPPAGGGSNVDVGTSGGFDTSEKSTKPPGCGQKEDGTYCDCVDVPLFTNPPNMYFVLDRSGSMIPGDKWTTVRIVVGKILRAIGPRASFGAMIFPGTGGGAACAPGTEVMSLRPGDPPSSIDGPTTKYLLTATQVPASGGTPTAAALTQALDRLRGVAAKTFVILATDGAPNCNSFASCSYQTCQLNIESAPGCPAGGPGNCCEPPDGYRENCLDDSATLSGIQALRSEGIQTYVVGLPGSATYASFLDQAAIAGGTAQTGTTKYFRVDATNEATLLTALKKIAAQIVATCVIELNEPPRDPNLVNVYLDEVVLPFNPADGWSIDGKTVTLTGAACQRVLSGDVLGVRVIAGCPRVEPR